ncbi:hypothetical protein P1P68_40930 [Streptomyces scabiei]|uniref:hypothetical protein n=1 Tax=Streptomyces scabiei TaxID=1930 RepID=UPI00298F5DCB|nr:hypothetical protein [Streptomyces scabiei]MDW8811003.1 hypothetical protein [Streptomyces scabiei]
MSPSSDPVSPLEQALHAARALVLADLAAGRVAEADVVSMVEESVVQRRWWVEQWPDGVPYVAGLVAQDVQDALLERYGRWPLCPVCEDGDPHALDVEPELGPDPHPRLMAHPPRVGSQLRFHVERVRVAVLADRTEGPAA